MKSNSNVRPPIIQDLGNGSYYYNYNIHEVRVPAEPIEGQEPEERTVFECEAVLIWGIPNYKKCVKAVLRDRRDETEEFNLINKYNAFALGVSEEEADKEEYEAYLEEVKAVKAMVKTDLEQAAAVE